MTRVRVRDYCGRLELRLPRLRAALEYRDPVEVAVRNITSGSVKNITKFKDKKYAKCANPFGMCVRVYCIRNKSYYT